MTYTLQIGNSDNKLTQSQWSKFIERIYDQLTDYATIEIHFMGGSNTDSPVQNYCFVFNCDDIETMLEVKHHIRHIRQEFNQDSVAWSFGQVEFI